MLPMTATPSPFPDASAGCRLVSTDGRPLPLLGAAITAEARAGMARVVLRQRFRNAHAEPLHVTYLMPLPADGAVSGYAFTIGERRVVGEVDRKHAARERFERALAEGRSAGLVEEQRSSLFTQELGNIPPGAEVVAEISVDQPLVWLEEGAWEWRFPTTVGPRYMGAEGRVPDRAAIEVAVADKPLPVRMTLALAIHDKLPAGRRPESPSHALAVMPELQSIAVALAAEGGAPLDRDVCVRWAAATPAVGVSLAVGRPRTARPPGASSFGLLTLVPPTAATARGRRRDLILLLDTSGSMGGEPLDQARRVCAALIDTLAPGDHLEMIEFSTQARRWNRSAVVIDEKQRRKAKEWLGKLSASGGTEMVAGVLEALAPLSAEAQRQVVLLTDGYIGFETEVVKAIRERLPEGSRLSVVGVGSSVNRSLTAPTARAGRGVEIVVAPGEDPERPAKRLCARTAMPVVTDVEIDGDALRGVAPARLPDLYGGCPATACLELAPAGGRLRIRGRSADGAWEQTVTVPPCDPGEGQIAAAARFARETVEDLELARAAGGPQAELDARIEKLGLDFQIATRLTTWVAIAEEAGVDPSQPTRREIVPHELPHGVSAEGVGLRAAAPAMAAPMAKTMMVGGPMQRSVSADTTLITGFGAGAAGMAPPPPPAPAAPPARKKAAMKEAERNMTRAGSVEITGPTLRGVVRLVQGGQVVIEVEIDDDLDWKPGASVVVRNADGSFLAVRVVAASTTRDGRLTAGQRARLTLELDAAPALVLLGEIVIEVRAA